MRSFLNLQAYWAAQISKGGKPAEMAKEAQNILHGDQSEPIEIDFLSIDDNMEGSGGISTNWGGAKSANMKHRPCGSYWRYTQGQITDMLGYKFKKMLTISKAAKLARIQPCTAATMVKKFEADMDMYPSKSTTRNCGL